MSSSGPAPETARPSPWLHRWAVLTVCATVALLLIGAKVTTLQVGMAETDWPTHPLHLFFASRGDAHALAGRGLGYVIEHSHRLAGYVVGCCAIVLAVLCWLLERRRRVRWLGAAALLGVTLQGILGGFRVKLNDLLGTDLATLHGCFAQLVFALLVSLALFTSRSWAEGPTTEAGAGVRRLSLWLCGLVFVQIVFGALVRHNSLRPAQRLHFLLAFAVVAAAAWLVRAVWQGAGDRRLRRAGGVLAAFLVVQLVLGVESWMMRFGSGMHPELLRLKPPSQVSLATGLVRTFHFVLGSLVFATAVVMALLAHQRPARAVSYRAVPADALEGAA